MWRCPEDWGIPNQSVFAYILQSRRTDHAPHVPMIGHPVHLCPDGTPPYPMAILSRPTGIRVPGSIFVTIVLLMTHTLSHDPLHFRFGSHALCHPFSSQLCFTLILFLSLSLLMDMVCAPLSQQVATVYISTDLLLYFLRFDLSEYPLACCLADH